MWKDHLCIVMAIEHYNPLGVIRTLGEAGVSPIFISIKGRGLFASASKYLSKVYHVDSIYEGYRLLIDQYGNVGKETGLKPFLFSSDDKDISFLDYRYDEVSEKFIFFNAGCVGRLNYYMDKNNILELAKKHGLNVLEARVCKNGELPDGLGYPVITKSISPVIGGWKSDVHICLNEQDLINAYETIESPRVLIQRYIEKQNEYCLEGFSANSGNDVLIAIANTYNYLLPDYYSPYMTVSEMKNEKVEFALKRMLQEIKYEGVFEAEFLVAQDGTLYFLEINFRDSTWNYASTKAGMPLPVLWAESQEQGFMRENVKKSFEPFTAMVEPIDFAKRVKTGKIDLAEWLKDFKEAKCGYYYNADDVEPWRICVENWDRLG